MPFLPPCNVDFCPIPGAGLGVGMVPLRGALPQHPRKRRFSPFGRMPDPRKLVKQRFRYAPPLLFMTGAAAPQSCLRRPKLRLLGFGKYAKAYACCAVPPLSEKISDFFGGGKARKRTDVFGIPLPETELRGLCFDEPPARFLTALRPAEPGRCSPPCGRHRVRGPSPLIPPL